MELMISPNYTIWIKTLSARITSRVDVVVQLRLPNWALDLCEESTITTLQSAYE